jgi:hypothetical protein
MNIAQKEERQQTGLSFRHQTVIFLLACIVLFSRRPDAILHAQFWAEDGRVWFADAYNFGWWQALSRTWAGYFQTFPRLCAALALLVPFPFAPLALNVIAIGVQALPVGILLSSRSAPWGNLRHRAWMAVLYLALPNIREIEAIATNSQWVLALCAFLLIVAAPPKAAAGKAFDIVILLLCGLTGPFCVFLVPIAVWIAWRQPAGGRRTAAGILAAACAVQAWALLLMDRPARANGPLGAGPGLLMRILGGHVFLGTLLGGNQLAFASSAPALVLVCLACVAGLVLVAVCFMRCTTQMKLFLFFSFAILAASLISPEAYPPPGVTRWQMLAEAGGVRYWFLPSLAFAWTLLCCFRARIPGASGLSAAFLLLMCFGIIRDWELPALTNLNFAAQANNFAAAPAGMAVVIPENPQGWTIELKKRPEH